MGFHQFNTNRHVPARHHLPLRKNPLDFIFSNIGLKKLGLDAIADYCTRYAQDWEELKPWMPDEIPDGSFLLDFHSHTNLSDGEGTFESILGRIAKSGMVDGIAFTNHPWYHGDDGKTRIRNEKVVMQSHEAGVIVKKMKQKGQLSETFITFEGSCEFAPKGTLEFPKKGVELIGIGLPDSFVGENGGLGRLRNLLAEDLVDTIHDAGGLAILPHPFYFEPAGLSRTLWKMVDAVETFNQTTHVFVEPVIREFAKHSTVPIPMLDKVFALQLLFGYFSWRNRVELGRFPRPEVGSSDAHIEPFIGSGCTLFPEPITDLEQLRTAFKKRKGTAILNPRWEQQANMDEIFERVWSHWGKEIVSTIQELHQERRAILPLLKLVTDIFKGIQSRRERACRKK